MPYSSAAERRPQLLNLWSLGVVAVLCLVILVLVFPQGIAGSVQALWQRLHGSYASEKRGAA